MQKRQHRALDGRLPPLPLPRRLLPLPLHPPRHLQKDQFTLKFRQRGRRLRQQQPVHPTTLLRRQRRHLSQSVPMCGQVLLVPSQTSKRAQLQHKSA